MHARQAPRGASEHASGHGGDSTDAGAPDPLIEAFKAVYRDTEYYSTGRDWADYEPAYIAGRELFRCQPLARFDELDAQLQAEWTTARGSSRLAWAEARGALQHAWANARALAPHPRAAEDMGAVDTRPTNSTTEDGQ